MASDTYQAVGGGVAAAVNARWATQVAPRRAVDWIPLRTRPVVRSDGTLTDEWYRFFAELARKQGGAQGQTLAEIVNSVTAVQAQAAEAVVTAQSASAAAQANEIAIGVVKEVTLNAGLDGAGEIP